MRCLVRSVSGWSNDGIELRRFLREHGAGNVRVFGSVARGEERADSDLDLIVDLGQGTGLFTLDRTGAQRCRDIVSRSDAEHLAAAQEHLRRLRLHMTRHDLSDDTVVDAACLRLAVSIESVAAVRRDLREGVFDDSDSWSAIWSVRKRIAHGYIYHNRAILEDTITHDLDAFEESIIRLVDLVTR